MQYRIVFLFDASFRYPLVHYCSNRLTISASKMPQKNGQFEARNYSNMIKVKVQAWEIRQRQIASALPKGTHPCPHGQQRNAHRASLAWTERYDTCPDQAKVMTWDWEEHQQEIGSRCQIFPPSNSRKYETLKHNMCVYIYICGIRYYVYIYRFMFMYMYIYIYTYSGWRNMGNGYLTWYQKPRWTSQALDLVMVTQHQKSAVTMKDHGGFTREINTFIYAYIYNTYIYIYNINVSIYIYICIYIIQFHLL